MDYYGTTKHFGGVYSRDNLIKLRDAFYFINLDDQQGPGTHWVVVFNIGLNCIYFDSFGVDPPEEVLHKMRETNKKIITNFYRIQDLESLNCGKFCIYVIDKLLMGRPYIEVLADFDPNDFQKNDHLISAYV